MPTRQYIGARYVPEFYNGVGGSAEWVNGVAYEALTIVTRLGASFTSRKPVPANIGAPENNPAYWVNTGNYNEQVARYVEEVQDVEDRLEVVEEYTAKQRHIVIIADGYGTYDAVEGHTLTNNLLDKFISYSGWSRNKVHYSAANDGGFCNGGFLAQLNNLNLPEDVAKFVTDVYVIGGWNDERGLASVSEEAFDEAAVRLGTRARALYPRANLHACFCAWGYRAANNMQNIRATQAWYFNLRHRGWIVEKNYAFILHNTTWFIGNNNNPNQYGVNELAAALVQLVESGTCHASYETNATYKNAIGTLPAAALIGCNQYMNDGSITIELIPVRGCIELTTPTSLNLDGNHNIKLFELDGQYIAKGYANNIGSQCSATIYSSGTRYVVPGTVTFNDGSVYFYPDYYPEGQTYLTLTIDKISIPKIEFTTKPW